VPQELNPIHFRRFWWADEASLPLSPGQTVWLADEPTVHYLATVLRCKVGDALLAVLAGDPAPWWVTVVAIERRRLQVHIERAVTELPLHHPAPVTLAMALIKDDPWEWVLQKATELGVARIVPLHTARCSVPFPPKPARLERWMSQIKAATLQSEGTAPPVLADPVGLADWLASSPLPVGSAGVVLQERAPHIAPLAQWLAQPTTATSYLSLTIVVGPEGGWTGEELALLQDHGFIPVSLGARVLRAETAALAAVVQVVANSAFMAPQHGASFP
jgi:16S rRNA (uracil1498-N3)-methyltransferase